jgi:hypothetical protein
MHVRALCLAWDLFGSGPWQRLSYLSCGSAPRNASARGGRKKRERKRRTSAPAYKKKYVRAFVIIIFSMIFFNRFFGRFATRGVQNHEKDFCFKQSIWAHYKKCGGFSLFFFSLCSNFFFAFLGVS